MARHVCKSEVLKSNLIFAPRDQSGLDCYGCGTSCKVFTSTTGSFTDGSGNQDYLVMAMCSWLIAPTGASNVTITFNAFSTEASYDIVNLYWCSDTTCATNGLITSLSGSLTNRPSYTSRTGVMWVLLTADHVITAAGFNASWAAIMPVVVVRHLSHAL